VAVLAVAVAALVVAAVVLVQRFILRTLPDAAEAEFISRSLAGCSHDIVSAVAFGEISTNGNDQGVVVLLESTAARKEELRACLGDEPIESEVGVLSVSSDGSTEALDVLKDVAFRNFEDVGVEWRTAAAGDRVIIMYLSRADDGPPRLDSVDLCERRDPPVCAGKDA
jgi:hypothetical protein